MTQYAAQPVEVAHMPALITKTYNIGVWAEMDRVRVQMQYHTVTLTGFQGGTPISATINGQDAPLAEVHDLYRRAKDGGEVEVVAEEAA